LALPPLKPHSLVPDDRPSQREPDFDDSSWPLFSIFSNIVEEEDNDTVERWEKVTQGIIIFVRPCAVFHDNSAN
jgi:hypothetical protein